MGKRRAVIRKTEGMTRHVGIMEGDKVVKRWRVLCFPESAFRRSNRLDEERTEG